MATALVGGTIAVVFFLLLAGIFYIADVISND